MRALRAALGSLLLILAGVVGLLGALLSVTILLLPVGIPLLFLAKKLFASAMTMFIPRKVRHPAQELGKSSRKAAGDAADVLKPSRKTMKRAKKKGRKVADKGRSLVAR
jgi:hypothetical protein